MERLPQKKIVAVIPCHNEERAIGAVIRAFPMDEIRARGFELDVLVVDNLSTDKTAERAREHGARVLHEAKKGKGNAMRSAFAAIPEDAHYVVMLDGDETYRPEEVLRLIELLDSGFAHAVIGSRLGGRVTRGSMTFSSRMGNWFFSHLVRYFYKVNITDVFSGYFGWTRGALMKLAPHLRSEGFAIEMEMVTKMAKLDIEVYCVPITYAPRTGSSHLRPLRDGLRILGIFLKNLLWRPIPRFPRFRRAAALKP